MAREQHDYDDIPGTLCRHGTVPPRFGINMFCMSLMKDENRKAFKANEAEYLKKFKLTPEQTDAVLKPIQPHAGARRQYLFYRQARRHRRPFVPATRGKHDRIDATGLRQHDARRRPIGRRQSLALRQERAVEISLGGGGEEGGRAKRKA